MSRSRLSVASRCAGVVREEVEEGAGVGRVGARGEDDGPADDDVGGNKDAAREEGVVGKGLGFWLTDGGVGGVERMGSLRRIKSPLDTEGECEVAGALVATVDVGTGADAGGGRSWAVWANVVEATALGVTGLPAGSS